MRRDVEAIVEVFAEAPRSDGFGQVDVGGGDQAHVDGLGQTRAEAHHLALLQHAQQLDLYGHRQIADLVEKQRAAVGRFEPASALLGGPRERALLVAEQLALDQRLREGSAVDRQKAARRGAD